MYTGYTSIIILLEIYFSERFTHVHKDECEGSPLKLVFQLESWRCPKYSPLSKMLKKIMKYPYFGLKTEIVLHEYR